jgi:hypothetical protein
MGTKQTVLSISVLLKQIAYIVGVDILALL